MNEYAVTTLYDVKAFLGVAQTDTTNDIFLKSLIAGCSRDAETEMNRKVRGRTFTEYHDGGHDHIFVRNSPIRSITSVHDDTDRDFVAGTLVSSGDYHYDGDYADQGRVQLYNVGRFSEGKKNVKIVYAGAFDEFVVTSGENDKADWYDEADGSEINTSLTAGTYTAADLATHIGAAMTLETSGDTVTCSYNAVTGKFTITSDGNDHLHLTLPWNTGTNAATSIGVTLGFDTSADDSGALTYTGDYAVLGIPAEIKDLVTLWVVVRYKKSFVRGGDGTLGIAAKNVGVTSTGTTYRSLAELEDYVKRSLHRHRRIPV